MARNYAALTGGPRGVFVPRWLLATALFLAGSLLAWMAFSPPSWTIQRLESPDGARTAVLSRTQFGRPHFVVRVKDGPAWRTVFVSPPLTNGFRVDLGERLAWSTNSATLFFRMDGRVVWKHDFRPAGPGD